MPMYIDVHRLEGLTVDDIASAHERDVAVQEKHGVQYVKYWLNDQQGKVFCLCTAPNAEAAAQVHLEASGVRADRIIEVDEELAESFMGPHFVAPTGRVLAAGRPDHGSRTIMFTDIVGSTALTQQLGDRAAMTIVEAHDRVVRGALAAHGGREVKHLGDGIMAVFLAPDAACACATRIHRALPAHDGITPAPIRVKIGAATGDPVERDGDFFGSTVQLAARLCAHAQASETLVSSTVIEQARAGRFDDLGGVQLKGFTELVHVHRLIDE